MHKSYQPDTERRKQAQRISMMGDPVPDVLDDMPWLEMCVWAAFSVIMVGIAMAFYFIITGAM